MKVVPVIVGVLGTTPSRLPKQLKKIGIDTTIVELQKTVLLDLLPTIAVVLYVCFKA